MSIWEKLPSSEQSAYLFGGPEWSNFRKKRKRKKSKTPVDQKTVNTIMKKARKSKSKTSWWKYEGIDWDSTQTISFKVLQVQVLEI